MLAYEREAATRLAELQGHEERATAIDAEHRDAVAAERKAAARVGRQRRRRGRSARRGGDGLSARAGDAPRHLTVELDDDPAAEHVQFLLAANPGAPPLPVAKAASGGELARTMLALRLVLTAPGDVPRTLVFDEVDAGIGGSARPPSVTPSPRSAARHQVLVVTHLAQVAAQATTQVAVEKRTDGATTVASAAVVTGEQRVTELARMLSGDEGGDAARRHAVELLGGR